MADNLECEINNLHEDNIEYVRENLLDSYYSSKLALLFKDF